MKRGFGLIVLLLVIAIIAILTVKMLGKTEVTPATEEAEQKAQVEKATTYQGAIQTKTKAQSAVGSENAYNQELQSELIQ